MIEGPRKRPFFMSEVSMDPIHLEVKLEPEDLVALLRYRSSRKRRLLSVMGWVLTVFGVGGLAFLDPDASIRQGLMICLAMGLWFLFLVWTQKGTFLKSARTSLAAGKPAKWTLTREGLHLESVDTKADLLWSSFSDCLELESILVLSGGPGDELIIPKRCVVGSGDLAQIREWAKDAGLRVS